MIYDYEIVLHMFYGDKRVYGSILNKTYKCHSTENKYISHIVLKYESTTKEYGIITNKLTIVMNYSLQTLCTYSIQTRV